MLHLNGEQLHVEFDLLARDQRTAINHLDGQRHPSGRRERPALTESEFHFAQLMCGDVNDCEPASETL